MNTKRQTLINQSAELYKMVGYPPTAGQIMGLLYVSDQKYFTFQELIDTLKISKSAISKSLNFLLEIKEISFKIKKDNKRKRYFYISKKGTIASLQQWIDSLAVRQHLFEQLSTLRNEDNKELSELIKNQIDFSKAIISVAEKELKKF
ncbi:MAG: hypothetical protein KGV44_00540 [Flavobacteriaceae bacterium]|nr:hypothetical protein [Flavobacteriaceae bacterium]